VGRRKQLIVGLALAVALASSGCRGDGDAGSRTHVILIVIDTLRAGHLGSYGYGRDITPFLDAFARESLRFERAIAASSWTSPSVASILSSLYPPALGISRGSPQKGREANIVLGEEVVTIAEILQGEGFQTLGVVANPWIARQLGYAQGFDRFFRARRSQRRGHASAESVNRIAFEALPATEDDPAPLFLYLLYMDPHKPYHPELRGAPLPALPTPTSGAGGGDRRARAIDGYDAEIRYLDEHLGELFDFLRQRGLYDDSIIVVTSDHGEQFYEYGHHDHGYTLHNPEVHVPLLVRVPGVEPGTDDTIVSTVDIVPTILDALGIEIAHEIEGVSLLAETGVRRDRGVFSGVTYWVEAFDSIGDYEERTPLGVGDLERDLRDRFDQVLADSRARRTVAEPQRGELDPEWVEQLKQLGYLE
jgi:arylsulfatase